jgi:hypothetical protein
MKLKYCMPLVFRIRILRADLIVLRSGFNLIQKQKLACLWVGISHEVTSNTSPGCKEIISKTALTQIKAVRKSVTRGSAAELRRA